MPEIAWGAIPTTLIVCFLVGFFPGAITRQIVRIYPKRHPRRQEIVAELYAVERKWRLVWVFEQLELALFEGLPQRLSEREPQHRPRRVQRRTYRRLAGQFHFWGRRDYHPEPSYLIQIALNEGLTRRQAESLVSVFEDASRS
jgi:hypothetical protein